MRLSNKIILLFSVLFFIVSFGYGQSLGDVARQEREKKQAKGAQQGKDQAKDAPAAPKVITNDDLPENPESLSDSKSEQDSASPAPVSSAEDMEKRGQEWKGRIAAAKKALADFQSQVDKLNNSIHFVPANMYSNGVQYNQYQLKKQQEVQQAQKQLDAERKKLADMQEAARKAGFGSSVYDP